MTGLSRILYIEIVSKALKEDIGSGDITTESIFGDEVAKAHIIAKEQGIIAGLLIAKEVFFQLDSEIEFKPLVIDGDLVMPGEIIAKIEGKAKGILTGERVALNFLQRMSGIASATNKAALLIRHTKARIADTRKTTPGMRILEKYSVRIGGGLNHRLNLSDMVLIKDNHIKGVGSINEAVRRVKRSLGFASKIEVETTTLNQVREALECGVDIIMLDNMSVSEMIEAVTLVAGRVLLEASGGITFNRLLEVANTGVDIISLGYLTSSATALDISLLLYEY